MEIYIVANEKPTGFICLNCIRKSLTHNSKAIVNNEILRNTFYCLHR